MFSFQLDHCKRRSRIPRTELFNMKQKYLAMVLIENLNEIKWLLVAEEIVPNS